MASKVPSRASDGSDMQFSFQDLRPVRTYSIAKLFVCATAQKAIRAGLPLISIGAPLLAETATWQVAVQLRDRTRAQKSHRAAENPASSRL
jgi:hypothetical protein